MTNVAVGIRGNYQVGRWTSIEADVDSDSWPVTLSVRVPDPDGHLTRQPSLEIPRPDKTPVRIRSLFKTGRLTDNDDRGKIVASLTDAESQGTAGTRGVLHVDIESPEGTTSFVLTSADASADNAVQVANLKDAWTLKTRLWAALGESEGFERAADRIVDRDGGSRLPVHLIKLESAEQLPAGDDALESLSLLVVTGRQTISAAADEAIRRWVFSGGHLIVSSGTPEDYSSLPMSSWLPIRITGQSRLRDLSNLTTQMPGSVPIRVSTVEALQFEFDQGEADAETLDGPLWARVPYGFGHITLLGVDLSRRPLVNWESLPLLCEKLAEVRPVSKRKNQRSTTAQLSQTGVSDLQTQLVTGLDQFPGSLKPTSWLAMGLILLYLLAIGPLDYLLVHKLLKRPQWTWVTFPCLVLLAAVAAAATARDRNPQTRLANRVDVVDVDVASESTRINSWVCFTSPATDRYRVDARPTSQLGDSSASVPPRICWAGVPEGGFRGMYRMGGLDQWKAAYSLGPQCDAILDLPISLWSSASVRAQWSAQPATVGQVVDASLIVNDGQLTGTLTNRLNTAMNDWFVAHEGRVYLPQTRTRGAAALKIAPQETLDFSDHRRVVPRVLQSFLTGVRRLQIDGGADRTGQDVVAVRDTYDPLERDPYNVWRMATFYDAADGGEFTALDNDALRRFDLSALLDLDRAVLFCRVDSSAVDFTVNEKPLETTEHETILRIVLPVERQ